MFLFLQHEQLFAASKTFIRDTLDITGNCERIYWVTEYRGRLSMSISMEIPSSRSSMTWTVSGQSFSLVAFCNTFYMFTYGVSGYCGWYKVMCGKSLTYNTHKTQLLFPKGRSISPNISEISPPLLQITAVTVTAVSVTIAYSWPST